MTDHNPSLIVLLIYIPASQDEIVFAGDPAEQAAKWQQLDTFINSVSYLRNRRGQYAERNGSRGPWSNIIDLKFLQDFSFDVGGKRNTGLSMMMDLLISLN